MYNISLAPKLQQKIQSKRWTFQSCYDTMVSVIEMIYNFDGLTFRILCTDIFEHTMGFYKVAARPYASLSLRTKGEAEIKIGNTHFKSFEGDVMFIPEGIPYEAKYTDGESAVVHLSECNYKNAENIRIEYSGVVNETFSELMRCADINGKKSAVYKILQILALRSEKKDADIERCASYINENYKNRDIKIEDICKAGNMSEATLRRKFHRYYGMSAKRYLIKKRMEEAVRILISGERTVKETAALCGFVDEKYFSKVIKEKYGITPKQFVK